MILQETTITYDDALYRHYYLYRYLPLTAGIDPLSRSLLKFKRGIQPDLGQWIENTLEVFQNIPPSPDTIIIRALHHDETEVCQSPPSPLDLVGQSLATRFHCQYQPSLLRKSHPTLSNKGLSRDQREIELRDVYSISPFPNPGASPNPPFLLIDDILTTGATIRTIIHLLTRSFPKSAINIFTLAKVDHPYHA